MTGPAAIPPAVPTATLHASLDGPVGQSVTLDGAGILIARGLRDIIGERMKQVDRHGRTIERDQATNTRADLATAAWCYADTAVDQLNGFSPVGDGVDILNWPWPDDAWNPESHPRANLVKAAALLWAAIDWLDNAPRDAGDVVALEDAA